MRVINADLKNLIIQKDIRTELLCMFRRFAVGTTPPLKITRMPPDARPFWIRAEIKKRRDFAFAAEQGKFDAQPPTSILSDPLGTLPRFANDTVDARLNARIVRAVESQMKILSFHAPPAIF